MLAGEGPHEQLGWRLAGWGTPPRQEVRADVGFPVDVVYGVLEGTQADGPTLKAIGQRPGGGSAAPEDVHQVAAVSHEGEAQASAQQEGPLVQGGHDGVRLEVTRGPSELSPAEQARVEGEGR